MARPVVAALAFAFAFALAACSFSVPAGGAGDDAPDDARPRDASDIDADHGPPYLRAIDIVDSQVDGGPHAQFPLLVAITNAPWLRSTGNGGDVATMNGVDLQFFADDDATMQLAHDVEGYNPMTGTLTAWVGVPMLRPTTVIYLRYGDATVNSPPDSTKAWEAYSGVWHLTDSLEDATGRNPDATESGTVLTTGQVSTARELSPNSDDYVDVGSDSPLDGVFAGGGTLEIRFEATSTGEGGYGRFMDKGHDNGWSWGLNSNNSNPSMFFVRGTSGGFVHWNTAAIPALIGGWHHAAVTYDEGANANNPTLYLDGEIVSATRIQASTASFDSDANDRLVIGNRTGRDRVFDGRLDEARVAETSRTSGWIRTAYRNMRDPAAFYTIGDAR